MKKLFILSALVCMVFSACGGRKDGPTVPAPITPESRVATATSRPTKIPTAQRSLTPTVTPLPAYPNKRVVFDYYVIGDHSVWDGFFGPDSFRSNSMLVLYDDGQFIITGENYRQKVLSTVDVERFLSGLEALGFYSLESNQKHDPTDKLYDYGNNYAGSYDGREYCISVKTGRPRDLCVYEPDMQFLIPRMKNILKYLDEYEPAGMTPYIPDRILLWIESAKDLIDENLPEIASPWDEHLPPLKNISVVYVDGAMAEEIYVFVGGQRAVEVFSPGGEKFIVLMDIVLPHQKLTNENV